MAIDSEGALARAVLIHGPLSRSALTSRLDLSPASLTRLAKPLLDRGILIELEETADGSVGRPSRPLDISPDAGQFIGIKLTGDRLYAVATGIRAEPIAWCERALDDLSPGAVVEQIAQSVEELAAADPVAVGVSLGGAVREGVAEHAAFLGWQNVPLAALLEQRLSLPVTVENDLVALAEAERWFGLGRNLDGFAVITIGAGVGYALVIDGRVVRTPDAEVGTGGHIPLVAHGALCPDGHRGCARALLTSGSIAAQVSTALEHPVTYDEVLTLAADGEPAARTVVDAAGDALGTFIALATNLTLQSSVVLAGEGITLYALVEDRVGAAVRAHRDAASSPVTIHVDDSGFQAWARGAAVVAIQASLLRLSRPRAISAN